MRILPVGMICLGLVAGTGPSAMADTVNIRLSEHFPITHVGSRSGAQYFMQRVEELVPGQVEFEHYPGEQLARAAGQLDAVRRGLADMAVVGLVYVTEQVPLSTVVELPGLYTDAELGARAFHRLAQEELRELEYDRLGVRPVFSFVVPPFQLLLTKPDPITDISQLEGEKLRVAGPTGEMIADSIGAVGVVISPTDMYLAVERGVVDGIVGNKASMFVYGLEQLLETYTTNASLGNVAFGLFVNEAKWQTIPGEVQEALLQAGEETGVNVARSYAEGDLEAIADLQELGKTVYELSPEVQEQMNERLVTVHEHWLQQMQQRNLPGEEVLETFQRYLEEVEADGVGG